MTGLSVQALGLIIGIGPGRRRSSRQPGDAGHARRCQLGAPGAVLDIAEDRGAGLLFSVGEDGFLRVWDTAGGHAGAEDRRDTAGGAVSGARSVGPARRRSRIGRRAVLRGAGMGLGRRRSCSTASRSGRSRCSSAFRSREPTSSAETCNGRGSRSSTRGTAHPCRFIPRDSAWSGSPKMSKTDATMMTYQPSGTISYWDMTTGKVIEEVPTAAGLVNVRMSADRTTLVGQAGTEVVGINAVTGAQRFRLDASRGRLDGHLGGRRPGCLPHGGRHYPAQGLLGGCRRGGPDRAWVRLEAAAGADVCGHAPGGR